MRCLPVLILLPSLAVAQVLEGDAQLKTQADVDAFSYTEVTGNLQIGDHVTATDISRLDSLYGLTTVGDRLTITNNPGLTSLHGLEGLKSLHGLTVLQNDALENLLGLGPIREAILPDPCGFQCSAGIGIGSNASLTSLAGLDSLVNIESLGLSFNPLLSDLSALENLQSIHNIEVHASGVVSLDVLAGAKDIKFLDLMWNEDLVSVGLQNVRSIGGWLRIAKNPKLERIDGLHRLKNIFMDESLGGPDVGSFQIYENASLTTLDGLDSLESIAGYVLIRDNPALVDIDDLSRLSTVGGRIQIERNQALTRLDGLSGLTQVGDYLKIIDNPIERFADSIPLVSIESDFEVAGTSVVDFQGFGQLEEVKGNLLIRENNMLKSLHGLDNLRRVGKEFLIRNPQLETLDGLQSLTSVDSKFNLYGNLSLRDVNGLESLEVVGSGDLNRDGIEVFGNGSLESLAGLTSLIEVAGNFSVSNNAGMTRLGELPSLTNLPGSLGIVRNHALEQLDGPTALETVGSIGIGGNEHLVSLAGLSSLREAERIAIGGTALRDLNDLSNLERAELSVTGNDSLVTVTGPNKLREGGVYFGENPTLIEVDGFDGLETGSVGFANNPSLERVGGFGALESTETLGFRDNHSLSKIDGFQNLTSVDWLDMTRSPFHTGVGSDGVDADLSGFSRITSVKGLMISDSYLKNVDGFSALETVGEGGLELFDITLRNVDGLSSLKQIVGDLEVYSWTLENLDGLSALTQVGGKLSVTSRELTQVDGLSALGMVGADLILSYNERLTNLDGLSGLVSIGGDLQVGYNPALTNVDGLSAVKSIGGNLRMESNASLASCSCGLFWCIANGCVSRTVTMQFNSQSGDCNTNGADLSPQACVVPSSTGLLEPADASTNVSAYATFSWQPFAVAAAYHLQIDRDSSFTSPIVDDSTLTQPEFTVSEPLPYSNEFYWHVRAALDDGLGKTAGLRFGPWSETRSFTVAVGTATEDEPGIPTAFSLHPAYPNPFNPSTTISYDMPEAAEVRLIVYDALGRQVEELGTRHLAPGTHSVTWDASAHPSGVYFVRMEAGAFTQTQRLLLLR